MKYGNNMFNGFAKILFIFAQILPVLMYPLVSFIGQNFFVYLRNFAILQIE